MVKNFKKVFFSLKTADLKINLRKHKFFAKEIKYLKHINLVKRITLNSEKIIILKM